MILKVATNLVLRSPRTEAVSQPIALYGSNLVRITALCTLGTYALRAFQSNDLDNWAIVGADPLLTQSSVSFNAVDVGASAGQGVLGADYFRLKFSAPSLAVFTVLVETKRV